MKVALVIGHNNIKKGAYSKFLKENEYDYYCDVINYFKNIKDVDVYYRKESGSYMQEMQKIVHSINLNKYDFAIELHFNSASDKAHGAEVLAHAKSSKGNKLANIFLEKLCREYKSKNRGIIKITDSRDRGGYGISKTTCPYILIEPFFGSNAEESKKFIDKEKFATFLIEFIKGVEL